MKDVVQTLRLKQRMLFHVAEDTIKYNRLTLIEKVAVDKHRNTLWKAICDCSKEIIVYRKDVLSNRTKSCGCWKIDPCKTTGPKRQRHGHSRHKNSLSPTYRTWQSMRQRCRNPKSSSYSHYGGRGITVCERWSNFKNFLEDMGERPSTDFSIDRIDSNGNYEPNNCRWISNEENGRLGAYKRWRKAN